MSAKNANGTRPKYKYAILRENKRTQHVMESHNAMEALKTCMSTYNMNIKDADIIAGIKSLGGFIQAVRVD